MHGSKLSAYRAFQALDDSTRAIPERSGPFVGGMLKQERIATRVVSNQRCTCERCRECLDNAKWERIFNEKFALKEPEVRGWCRSPLADL